MLMQPRDVRPLTFDEMEALERAATSVETLESGRMASPVFDMWGEAKRDGDDRLADTYRLLAFILLPDVELMERIQTATNVVIRPSDLTTDECELLASLVERVSDPEMRARFADYLWIAARDHRYAEIAVDAYLLSAHRLRDPENWLGCAGRYERAAKLAASLGKKTERFTGTVQIIEEYLLELNGTDPLFLTERLITTLLDLKQGDPSRYAQLAEKSALAAEGRKDFFLALRYWSLLIRCYVVLEDTEGQKRARIAAAESVIQDGESHTTGDGPSFAVAAGHLRRGLAMLTKAGASQSRIDEVAARMKDYQRRGLAELQPHRSSFDASEFIAAARAAVAGKPLAEALAAFAELPLLPNRDSVRTDVLRRAKKYFFTHLFAVEKWNKEGAPIAGRGRVTGDETEETEAVLASMYDDVVRAFNIDAQATIEPAWRQIQEDHDIREQDMAILAQQSWFVPPSREPYFAKGMAAGFNGDLITAIHLLVPQMEGAIRWHLKRRGVNTIRQNRDGYEEERDLNQLLAVEEAKTLLGESLHFALTALLTSRFGYNLRNKLSHALVEPQDCYSTLSLFFFAVVVRICVVTLEQNPAP